MVYRRFQLGKPREIYFTHGSDGGGVMLFGVAQRKGGDLLTLVKHSTHAIHAELLRRADPSRLRRNWSSLEFDVLRFAHESFPSSDGR